MPEVPYVLPEPQPRDLLDLKGDTYLHAESGVLSWHSAKGFPPPPNQQERKKEKKSMWGDDVLIN